MLATRQNDGFRTAPENLFDSLLLLLEVVVAVSEEEDLQVGKLEAFRQGANGVSEVGIFDRRDGHGNKASTLRAEVGRRVVEDITEVFDYLQNTFPRLLPDRGMLFESAGDGHDGDTRLVRHILRRHLSLHARPNIHHAPANAIRVSIRNYRSPRRP
ncbi:hypothetical protein ACSSV1_005318 [Labrenzia sp. MBR-25]